jgi:crossover junction endodeoxyribonuclease RuvC
MIRGGIDNGLDGAIVAIDRTYSVVCSEVMPVIGSTKRQIDMVALLEVLASIQRLCRPSGLFFVLERAQAMPKQGGVSMFNYGMGYGAVQMALMALKIPHEIVGPRPWQKAVGVIAGGDTKAQAIAIVQRRIPTLDLTPGKKRVPHNGLADAGCMALHASSIRPFSNDQFFQIPIMPSVPPPPDKR